LPGGQKNLLAIRALQCDKRFEGVSDAILWSTIQRDLPVLQAAVEALLSDPDVT